MALLKVTLSNGVRFENGKASSHAATIEVDPDDPAALRARVIETLDAMEAVGDAWNEWGRGYMLRHPRDPLEDWGPRRSLVSRLFGRVRL